MNDWLEELERRAERGRRRPPEELIAEAIHEAREGRGHRDSRPSEVLELELDSSGANHAGEVPLGRLRRLVVAAAVATIVVGGLGAVIRLQNHSSTVTAELSDPAASGAPIVSPDNGPTSDWIGTWTWTEFYDNGTGTATELVHVLELEGDVGPSGAVEGWLEQRATNVEAPADHRIPVFARRSEQGDGSVEIVSVDGESAEPYPLGTVLFRLSGDPAEPTTTLVSLVTVVPIPAIAEDGVYFLPES